MRLGTDTWPRLSENLRRLRAVMVARSRARRTGWTHFLDPDGTIVSYGPSPSRRSPTFKRRT